MLWRFVTCCCSSCETPDLSKFWIKPFTAALALNRHKVDQKNLNGLFQLLAFILVSLSMVVVWYMLNLPFSTGSNLITNKRLCCSPAPEMINSERGATNAAAAEPSDKKEMEKKKRSRVKQLLSEVKKQVEFWFGDVNLSKDRFLKKLMEESDRGCKKLSILYTFHWIFLTWEQP